jgi:hypothetical protein
VRTETLPDGTTRYSLLELIREFALERLRECGVVETAQCWHAEAFAALAWCFRQYTESGEGYDLLQRPRRRVRRGQVVFQADLKA